MARHLINKKPKDDFCWLILALVLKATLKIEDALIASKKVIELTPENEIGINLHAIILTDLKEFAEAEKYLLKAIDLKQDFADAHNNLGNVLRELGRLEEARDSYSQVIRLNPDFLLAHVNLTIVLYNMRCMDLALESIEKANQINSQSKDIRLLLSVIKSRKSQEDNESLIGNDSKESVVKGISSNPLVLNRKVEDELVSYICTTNSRTFNETKDARYGNGKCSSDFNLFDDSNPIIKKIEEDLTDIMMEAVKSEIHIYDSFFNIIGNGGGSTPHKHLNELDGDTGCNLGKQKYSLVYYLSVGDQTDSEPGILKLNDPVEDILPCDGMIVIIPANREHSAVYNGKTDRIMIGVNFYSI